jgi:diguanylate cyclase (GGDEF)-like protein
MNQREVLEGLEEIVAAFRVAVFTDDKTPLRSAFALREEADTIDQSKSNFDVVIFGDLNQFKRLNDQHGHEAGDLAIREAGKKLHQVAVNLDGRAFRQSGDEFAMLLQQSQLAAFALNAASFAEISFEHDNKSLKTAMSFGYAVNDGKLSFRDLLRRAEMACQYAKYEGDGVCVGWTGEIQRNPLVTRRARCRRCRAKINCTVPQQSAHAKLSSCPCCGESLKEIRKSKRRTSQK